MSEVQTTDHLLSPQRIRQALARCTGQQAKVAPRMGRRASVAVVLRYPESLPEVLLMRRIERRGDPWSGHVSLPGGRAEPEDASPRETAERETLEEVGIDLRGRAEYLGPLPPARPRLFRMQISPHVYHLQRGVEATAGDEARWTFWLSLARVLSGELDGTHYYRLGPVRRPFPCWRYNGEVIWGLTHRILGEMLGLITGRPLYS